MPATLPRTETDPAYTAGGATDAELAAALVVVNAAMTGKQDAATAATDAEVAAAIAIVNAAVAGKQDAGTAATDAELAAAVEAHRPLVVAAGNFGAAYQLNAQGRDDVLLTGTLNANNALTFTNLAAGSTVTIVLTQDATGNRTLTVNGAAVAVNPTAASVTVLRAYTPDGSTVYVDAPGVDPGVIGASVARSTALSAANGGFLVVTWEAEGWDTHSFVNLGTSATRITIPTGRGGLYAVSWSAAWAINSTGTRASWVRLNGGTSYPGNVTMQAKGESVAPGYVETPLAAADYLEMVVYQDSGGALNLTGGVIHPWPRLTVRRLGPTP